MRRLRLWAPFARAADLVIADRREPLAAAGDGVFTGEIGEDTPYFVSLDGGDGLPDPRSELQLEGVHGPSRLVAHGEHEWHDDAWRGVALRDAIFYEIHTGTFTEDGTFDGVAGKLAYLRELGITAIELMPVAAFPGTRGWGYDGVGLFAVQACYGGPAGLKRLVDVAHQNGLAVFLDVVYNHLGPEGNYLDRFGPYFSETHTTPWGRAVNFDGDGCNEVRGFVTDNVRMWLGDYHLDGLRLDATHAIIDDSDDHILSAIAREARVIEAETGRTRLVIAESDANDASIVRSPIEKGKGLDGQWSEDAHHSIHALITGERGGYYADFGSREDVAGALNRGFVYDGRFSVFRRSEHGSDPTGIALCRFIACQQNHDQVGNRALGDRIGAVAGSRRQMLAAALVILGPLTPLIFMGEEHFSSSPFLYFTDHSDPALREAVRQGRIDEFGHFGWRRDELADPEDASSFRRSRLRWSEIDDGIHHAMLDWYRSLIALRKRYPTGELLSAANVVTLSGALLTVDRGPLRLLCNVGDRGLPLESGTSERVVLSNEPIGEFLAPWSAAVLLRE